MSGLPTLVFIPGAWHKPTCYDKIINILQKYKLKCISITLPSTLGNPEATFKDDLDITRNSISSEIGQGNNVVVIAHSYGGMVGNSAIKGFAKPKGTDEASSTSIGHVIGLILIASGYTFTGLSFMDPFFGNPPPAWRVNNETGFAELVASPREFFYHDVPTEEVGHWIAQLTPQSLKSLFEGGEHSYAGWTDVPSWYIGTIEDQGLPVVVQRMAVAMAREMGAQVEHREMQTSHSPFLSKPEETAEIVLEAVEAFSGMKVGTRRELGNEVIVPHVRILQPLTWYRFGLPMLFGRSIGRGILVFRWFRGLWNYR
jgi:pimeloyl-ACP methyl ester carboxylesterase